MIDVIWSRLLAPEPSIRWIVALAGGDVVLALKQAVQGQWYRLLPARDYEELEERVRIIEPAIILVEVLPSALDPIEEFHRHHPLTPWIAVVDAMNSNLAPLLAERGARKTLIKPLDVRRIRNAVETELPDARLG